MPGVWLWEIQKWVGYVAFLVGSLGGICLYFVSLWLRDQPRDDGDGSGNELWPWDDQ